VADSLFERLATGTPDQLRRMRQKGKQIKSDEEIASRTRLARMWAEDDRRRQALADAHAERERQERLILMASLALVGLAIVVVIVLAISGAPGPSRCL